MAAKLIHTDDRESPLFPVVTDVCAKAKEGIHPRCLGGVYDGADQCLADAVVLRWSGDHCATEEPTRTIGFDSNCADDGGVGSSCYPPLTRWGKECRHHQRVGE
jgi:hypothetical protein